MDTPVNVRIGDRTMHGIVLNEDKGNRDMVSNKTEKRSRKDRIGRIEIVTVGAASNSQS